MIRAIRALPNWIEMAIVIAIAFGMFIWGALAEVVDPIGVIYHASDFTGIALYEIALGSILLAFLFARGWQLPALGFVAPSVRDATHAAILFAVLWSVNWIIWVAMAPPMTAFNSAVASGELVDQQGLALSTVLIFSLINSTFEELFVCAYIIAAWRGPRLSLAILLSSLVRLSYHLYQGPTAILMLLPFGVIAAWYFSRTRRIAPLIAVHFIFDVMALLPYVRS